MKTKQVKTKSKKTIENELFSVEQFEKKVTENHESKQALKNKRLVRIASRTYANSIIRRNNALTESASIDIVLAAVRDLSEAVTVQQCVEFCTQELIMMNRSRFVDHLRKNKHQAQHVEVLGNDILKFNY